MSKNYNPVEVEADELYSTIDNSKIKIMLNRRTKHFGALVGGIFVSSDTCQGCREKVYAALKPKEDLLWQQMIMLFFPDTDLPQWQIIEVAPTEGGWRSRRRGDVRGGGRVSFGKDVTFPLRVSRGAKLYGSQGVMYDTWYLPYSAELENRLMAGRDALVGLIRLWRAMADGAVRGSDTPLAIFTSIHDDIEAQLADHGYGEED